MTQAAEAQNDLDKIWEDDLLGRRREADFLLKFLVHRASIRATAKESGAYVLNIDAEWGQGKSFFMRHFLEHIRAHDFPAVYVDAWEDDFTSEPLTAVMSAIDEFVAPLIENDKEDTSKVRKFLLATKRHFGRIAITAGVGALKKGANKLIGSAAEEVIDLYRSEGAPSAEAVSLAEEMADSAEESVTANIEALLDKFAESQIERFKEAKSSLVGFRTNLEAFLGQLAATQNGKVHLPFFILIDELDRCRPTYAVEMLERIKHLFDVPNVVFVLSTNTTQLSHAVGAVYGSNFNGINYLDRFFHRTYMMPTPEKEKIIDYLLATSKIDLADLKFAGGQSDLVQFIYFVDLKVGLTLRELERAMEILSALIAVWHDPHRKIDILIMFPMIAAFIKKQDITLAAFQRWAVETLTSKDYGIRLTAKDYLGRTKTANLRVDEYIHNILRRTTNCAQVDYNNYQRENTGEFDDGDISVDELILQKEISNALYIEAQAAGATANPNLRSSLTYYRDHIQHAGRLAIGAPREGPQQRGNAGA